MEEMSKVYEPHAIEQDASRLWQELGSFRAVAPASPAATDKTYTIVIPPPNVTAALHLGHALNNTLQDILIRWRRMQGFNTLWMPGTDHAGIATQTVVEKRLLADEGKRRTDFSREAFVGRVQAWKDDYEARIINQLKLMGCSCDWERTRFTMDAICARAVRATFFKLFADGLIFRGKRLVNWDPATQTVLADDEVEHESIKGYFWYLRYPLAEPVDFNGGKLTHITVATTRPETMLGDTAVAMNPSDPRAPALVGRMVRLPMVGRLIPIIADAHVVLPDPDSSDEKARFSTGFLKVTPAHDPNDYQIGQRHGLPLVNVMAPDGSISRDYGWSDWDSHDRAHQSLLEEWVLGKDRFEARETIVEWFRQNKLLEEVRDHVHEVGHSYRSHVPIEPYLSDQWYVAVKKPIDGLAGRFGAGPIEGTDVPVNSLAGLALKPLLDGRLRFTPERYTRNYQLWLENLRDWPISRQLWWGHQIPVWSKAGVHPNRCEHGTVSQVFQSEQGPVTYACVKPGFEELEQVMETEGWVRDGDVLDTWFSSALWPFSTLGWPEPSADLSAYYPGSVLCTAREIITLWVSRMVMMGQYCLGDIPFADVFIHAMIQDGEGRKMSKSLGNGIDPLDIIDSHGADAMRFALANMTTQTQDVRLPVEPMTLPDGRTVNSSPKFDLGRSFCNKLWNASRFAMGNLEGTPAGAFDPACLQLEDRWILSRLARTSAEVTGQLEAFRFSEPIQTLYRFFWNELCDWYLEFVKPRMRDDRLKPAAQRVLAYVLDSCLRLLHPFLPFITEGIYQPLRQLCPDRSLGAGAPLPDSAALITAAWPGVPAGFVDAALEAQMDTLQAVIRTIREIRTQYQVPPKTKVAVIVKTQAAQAALLEGQRNLLMLMAGLESLQTGAACTKPANAATAILGEMEIHVGNVVDAAAETDRLQKRRDELAKGIGGAEAKLNNPNFVSRAQPEVVQRERERLDQMREQLALVEKNLAGLSGPS